MKTLYIGILAIVGLFIGGLTVLAIEPTSLRLDAASTDTKAETKTVDIEMVSLDLTSPDSSEVGGDGEDIGHSSGGPTPTLFDDGIEHEDIGVTSGGDDSSGGPSDDGHKGEIDVLSATKKTTLKNDEIMVLLMPGPGSLDEEKASSTRMNKADLIESIASNSEGGLRAVFVKIEGIEGESKDETSDDSDLDLDDDSDGASAAKTSKPKEIVVVGSKVRGKNVPQLLREDSEEKGTPDSFFDIWVEAMTEEGASAPDSFFDIFVDITDEDLQLHAVSVAQSNKAIKEIKLTDEEVRVDYFEEVKLFGLIPVETTKTITVNTNAAEQISRVKVRMPWWHIFAVKNTKLEVLTEDIETALNKDIPAKDDRPTEEVAFYFNKISAQTLQTISNVSKAQQEE